MADTTIDKEVGLVSFVTADVALRRTIRYDDCVISVVPTVAGTTYKKVNQLLYNETTGKLIVVYEP